jgi:hypothetical protein
MSAGFTNGPQAGGPAGPGRSFKFLHVGVVTLFLFCSEDIGEALDDMLFAGGKLNVKLLGGVRERADA